MTLTLYHIPDWASVIIRLALEEAGIAHEIRLMDREAGDLASPAFRALNPLGLLPTLDTPEGPIFETAAILLWLNERYGGLGPREGEPGRLAFLSWLLFTSNTLHPTVTQMYSPEKPAGEGAAPLVSTIALARLNELAGQLEAMIIGQRPSWLSPESPGALGHYLGVLFRWAACLPPDPAMRFSLAPFPALTAVLAAHEASPAARKVARADGLGRFPYTRPLEGAAA